MTADEAAVITDHRGKVGSNEICDQHDITLGTQSSVPG